MSKNKRRRRPTPHAPQHDRQPDHKQSGQGDAESNPTASCEDICDPEQRGDVALDRSEDASRRRAANAPAHEGGVHAQSGPRSGSGPQGAVPAGTATGSAEKSGARSASQGEDGEQGAGDDGRQLPDPDPEADDITRITGAVQTADPATAGNSGGSDDESDALGRDRLPEDKAHPHVVGPDVPASVAASDADDVTRLSGHPVADSDDITRVDPAAALPSGDHDAGDITEVAGHTRHRDEDITHVQIGAGSRGSGTNSREDHSGNSVRHHSRTNPSEHSDGASWKRLSDLDVDVYVGVGTLLKGRFLLEREIGRGGMGVVYLARDARKVEARDRNPHIAVKVLNDEFRKHPDSLIALQRESMRAQSLAHDNVVRVYDFDKDGAVVFMTMEYVDGIDMRGMIRQQKGAGLAFKDAWPLIQGMGLALERAHKAGIVHSDFKPGNVMVGPGQVAKVFDFGIARAAKFANTDAGEDHTVFDASTLRAMTPAYASLQMLEGRDPSFSDDVYGFGCVAYELLTGRHPFGKDTAEQARARKLRPAPVAGLTRRQNKALRKCLSFQASERPAMAQVLADLRPRTRMERLLPYTAAAIAAIVLGVSAAGMLVSHRQQQEVAGLLARFSADSPNHFVDEIEVQQALEALDENDRRRLLVDSNSTVESFLLNRVAHYWNPEKQRFDYPGAKRVFDMRDRWKLFSPRMDEQKIQIQGARNEQLNALDTRLNDAIKRGALLSDQPDNVLPMLAQIRQLDPASRLLINRELQRKYETGVSDALKKGDRQLAKRWLASGLTAFPESEALNRHNDELSGTDASARVPDMLQHEAQGAQQAEEKIQDEVAARIESLRAAAAAFDVAKVDDLMAAIRSLQPDNPFLGTEGRKLVSDANLGRARIMGMQGNWSDAADLLAAAAAAHNLPALRLARQRYLFASDLKSFAASGKPDTAHAERLRARMMLLKARDSAGFKQLEQDIGALKQTPNGTGMATALAQLAQMPESAAASAPPQATGGTSSCQANYSGRSGAACADVLADGASGPKLLMLPMQGARIAMMRDELTMTELAAFCARSGACKVSTRSRLNAPADEISYGLAERYARWLSEQTGKRYRLPTDGEWLRAALAGSSPEACELAVSNRWGLRSMAGGVGEWVSHRGGAGIRGGDRRSSACAPDGMQTSDGSAKRGVGVRLVREL